MCLGTGSPKFLVWKFDCSRAPCFGVDQKACGLWERDWYQFIYCSGILTFQPLDFSNLLIYLKQGFDLLGFSHQFLFPLVV